MVHVVPCHHFVSQDVFVPKQEPVAFCCAQGKMLIATPENVVSVHSLDSRGSILHSFATVDRVEQIIYCEIGNYVATLEKKTVKPSRVVSHVRVYFNWWMEMKAQPVKVHVAGSMLPACHSHNDQFETVELPLNENLLCIACCKTTAVLGVSLGKKISVFCYSSGLSDMSKLKHHDFYHFIDIEMNLVVMELGICESYFACMSRNQVQVFKISIEKENTLCSLLNCEDIVKDNETKLSTATHDLECDEHFIEWRFESCTASGTADAEWENMVKNNTHPSSSPVNVTFPFIEKFNQKSDFVSQNCEIIGPMLTTMGHRVKVKLSSRIFEQWPALSSTNIDAVTFLFRQFELCEDQEKLKCLHLIPLYQPDYASNLDPLHAAAAMASENNFSHSSSPLISHFSSQLKTVGCFFSRLKEGFMYEISHKVQLISSYHYTANLKSAIVDTSFVHALTDAGLETYTSHLPHCAVHKSENLNGVKNFCPDPSSPVCLLGLRPFLGVSELVMSENHIILISSLDDGSTDTDASESKNSTLYVLKKPTAQQVFSDLLEIGHMYKSSSPSTYQFVLNEGHMILRAHMFLHRNQEADMETLYRKSCILLGDYLACSSSSSDKKLAVPYYHLSKLEFGEVIERLYSFQNQMKHGNANKALLLYLNSTLLGEYSREEKVVPKYMLICMLTGGYGHVFSPSTSSIADIILDVYMECSPDNLWRVIICSGLQGYKIEKAMLLLKKRITSKRHVPSSVTIAADTMAMVSLLLKKGNSEAAQTMLLSLPKSEMCTVMMSVHEFILYEGNLSPLGKFIKRVCPNAFVEFLFHVATDKKLKISDVIDVLQKDAPEVQGIKVPLMQEFFERLWMGDKNLFLSDWNCGVLLGKMYWCHLNEQHKESASSNMAKSFTFGERPSWLNELPPFDGRLPSSHCALVNSEKKEQLKGNSNVCPCFNCNEYLIKLQCLLCEKNVYEDLREHILHSVSESSVPYHLSLKVLCSSEEQSVTILLETYPKGVLAYAKEMFGSNEEKWCKLFPSVQRKMQHIKESDPNYYVYSEIFNGVLTNLAEILCVSSLISLLPPGENSLYVPYVKRCCERQQSLQLKNKIVDLGNEIKAMM